VLEVISDVDDDGQVFRGQGLSQARSQPGAADSAGESDDFRRRGGVSSQVVDLRDYSAWRLTPRTPGSEVRLREP
jgi:hypothetical protein